MLCPALALTALLAAAPASASFAKVDLQRAPDEQLIEKVREGTAALFR